MKSITDTMEQSLQGEIVPTVTSTVTKDDEKKSEVAAQNFMSQSAVALSVGTSKIKLSVTLAPLQEIPSKHFFS
jgi:hypothetical protein